MRFKRRMWDWDYFTPSSSNSRQRDWGRIVINQTKYGFVRMMGDALACCMRRHSVTLMTDRSVRASVCVCACWCSGAAKVFSRALTVKTTPPPAALHPSTKSTSSLCAASNARSFSTRWRTPWRTARRGALSRRCAARESRCWPAERTVGVFPQGCGSIGGTGIWWWSLSVECPPPRPPVFFFLCFSFFFFFLASPQTVLSVLGSHWWAFHSAPPTPVSCVGMFALESEWVRECKRGERQVTEREGARSQAVEHERRAALPAALAAQILTTGLWEPMPLLWDKPKLWRQPVSVGCGQAVCCCCCRRWRHGNI